MPPFRMSSIPIIGRRARVRVSTSMIARTGRIVVRVRRRSGESLHTG
ncbi:UNVERIFIED_ORG: hypothetical protein QOE_3608 [Clostridioides difficile F501]|nr:hypothetical protein HMPREF9404_5267 [Eggerthella sp. HGA1]